MVSTDEIDRALDEDIALQCGDDPADIQDEVDADGRVISDAEPGL